MQLITIMLCSILCIEQGLFNVLLQGHTHYETQNAQTNLSTIFWS